MYGIHPFGEKNGVFNAATKAWIPPDPMNSDWREYQAWLKAGNTPAHQELTMSLKSFDPNTKNVIVKDGPGFRIVNVPKAAAVSGQVGVAPYGLVPGDEKFLIVKGGAITGVNWEAKVAAFKKSQGKTARMSLGERLKAKWTT